jgi:hypothetical protein
MLHNQVYNDGFTADINTAIIAKDADFFAAEIHRLCAVIAARETLADLEATVYDAELTRLHLCLGFLDSLQRRGETVKLLCDMVNF